MKLRWVFSAWLALLPLAMPAHAREKPENWADMKGRVYLVDPDKGSVVFLGWDNRLYWTRPWLAKIQRRGGDTLELDELFSGQYIRVKGFVYLYPGSFEEYLEQIGPLLLAEKDLERAEQFTVGGTVRLVQPETGRLEVLGPDQRIYRFWAPNVRVERRSGGRVRVKKLRSGEPVIVKGRGVLLPSGS